MTGEVLCHPLHRLHGVPAGDEAQDGPYLLSFEHRQRPAHVLLLLPRFLQGERGHHGQELGVVQRRLHLQYVPGHLALGGCQELRVGPGGLQDHLLSPAVQDPDEVEGLLAVHCRFRPTEENGAYPVVGHGLDDLVQVIVLELGGRVRAVLALHRAAVEFDRGVRPSPVDGDQPHRPPIRRKAHNAFIWPLDGLGGSGVRTTAHLQAATELFYNGKDNSGAWPGTAPPPGSAPSRTRTPSGRWTSSPPACARSPIGPSCRPWASGRTCTRSSQPPCQGCGSMRGGTASPWTSRPTTPRISTPRWSPTTWSASPPLSRTSGGCTPCSSGSRGGGWGRSRGRSPARSAQGSRSWTRTVRPRSTTKRTGRSSGGRSTCRPSGRPGSSGRSQPAPSSSWTSPR